MKPLTFSPEAAADLEEIGDYIAKDNPTRALSFLDELENYCYQSAERPEAFPKREDLAPGLRMAVYGNYLILFRIQAQEIRIERIVHGARKLGDLQ